MPDKESARNRDPHFEDSITNNNTINWCSHRNGCEGCRQEVGCFPDCWTPQQERDWYDRQRDKRINTDDTPTPKQRDAFVTKDSGDRQEFGNGSVRDIETGKPRYDLIPPIALQRLAMLMSRGAEKYGARNWELGQPSSRFLSSAMRHIENYRLGDREEDHLAAAAYNLFALMHFENTDWDDINDS